MNRSPRPAALLAVALILSVTTPASARAQDEVVATLDDVVVVARRSGAPVWRVQNGPSTVILVGSILSVPRETPWRPEALEAAVVQADTVILSQAATMSLGDYFRMRRARATLPEGTVTADYLDPDLQRRLDGLGAHYRQNYSERGLVAIARDLLDRRLRYERGTGLSAEAVVRSAARKADRPVRLVGDMDARHVDESVARPDPTQIACVGAAIAATEGGAAGVLERGRAWTSLRVAEVVASPVEQAVDRCAWFADQTLRVQARAQWAEAVSRALDQPGVIMIVAPITMMAESGGFLDQIEARGLEVEGPDWRPGP
jgi:hypothetical protein